MQLVLVAKDTNAFNKDGILMFIEGECEKC